MNKEAEAYLQAMQRDLRITTAAPDLFRFISDDELGIALRFAAEAAEKHGAVNLPKAIRRLLDHRSRLLTHIEGI